MVDLSVDFLGVKFKNPIVAAAGTITQFPSNMRNCIKAGVGGVSTKSYHINPEPGSRMSLRGHQFLDKYGRPGSMTYAVGGSRLAEEFGQLKYIDEVKPEAEKEGVILIGNIDIAEEVDVSSLVDRKALVDLAKKIEGAGADMLEIAVGSSSIIDPAERKAKIGEVCKLLPNIMKGEVSIPMFMKFGWTDLSFLVDLLEIIENQGIQGCEFLPDINMTVLDVETGKPFLPISVLRGRETTPISAYGTAFAAKRSKLRLVPGGGLYNWRDIVESIMCGATLTAVHTAPMYRGYKVFGEMLAGLRDFMERKGYQKVDDFRGVAVDLVADPREAREELYKRWKVPKELVRITVDPIKCNGCEKCLVCIQDSVTMAAGIAQIDLKSCIRCGVCESICPTDAIAIELK